MTTDNPFRRFTRHEQEALYAQLIGRVPDLAHQSVVERLKVMLEQAMRR